MFSTAEGRNTVESGDGWTDKEILGRLVPSVEGGLKLLDSIRQKDTVETVDLCRISAAFGLAKYWIKQWEKKIESKDGSREGHQDGEQGENHSYGVAEGEEAIDRSQ